MIYLRKGHAISGCIIFGIGLFFCYVNSVYVVEFFKGLVQPLTILIGLTALAAAILGKKQFAKFNYGVAIVSLIVGSYGLYDEYYAVLDFFYGFMPLALLFGGIVAVVHGVKKLK